MIGKPFGPAAGGKGQAQVEEFLVVETSKGLETKKKKKKITIDPGRKKGCNPRPCQKSRRKETVKGSRTNSGDRLPATPQGGPPKRQARKGEKNLATSLMWSGW